MHRLRMMVLKGWFFLLIVLVTALAGPVQVRLAFAQSCETPYEVILTLRLPRFGVPSVWDAHYRQDQAMVQFSAGLPMKDGTVLAVGEILSAENFRPEERLMVRINRRGRTMMEKRLPAKPGEHTVAMIERGSRYIVVSNFSGPKAERQVHLSWHSHEGNLVQEKTLHDPAFDYEATAMIPALEGGGFVVAVHAVNRRDRQDQQGLLFRFADNGQEIWRRAYRPGIPNMLAGITAVPKSGHYLASGRIRMEDGRMAGWILELSDNGTVVWQRTYPRGAYSSLNAGVVHGKEYVLIGDSSPLDEGHDAAWIMSISAQGEPVWQRYMRGREHSFMGKGIIAHADGRLSAVLNAETAEGALQNTHIRLLTLTSYGEVIGDEPYISGIESTAASFFLGNNNERIIIANDMTDPEPEKEDGGLRDMFFGRKVKGAGESAPAPDANGNAEGHQETAAPLPAAGKPKPERKGWILVATPLDPYKDPCYE